VLAELPDSDVRDMTRAFELFGRATMNSSASSR
jgi:hypothetical protein